MPIKMNDSIEVVAPRNPDAKKDVFQAGKSRPFNNVNEFLTKWTIPARYEGMEVPVRRIGTTNEIDIYWFLGGVQDSNLVLQTPEVDLSNYYTIDESDERYIYASPTTAQVDNIFLQGQINLKGAEDRGRISTHIDENESEGQGGTAVGLIFYSNGKTAQIRFQPAYNGNERLIVQTTAIPNHVIAYLSDLVGLARDGDYIKANPEVPQNASIDVLGHIYGRNIKSTSGNGNYTEVEGQDINFFSSGGGFRGAIGSGFGSLLHKTDNHIFYNGAFSQAYAILNSLGLTLNSLAGLGDRLVGSDPNGRLKIIQGVVNPEIVEVDTFEDLPVTGETNKLYYVLTGAQALKTYRWGGTTYVDINSSGSLQIGTTPYTAGQGDHTQTAWLHSLEQGNPHNTQISDINGLVGALAGFIKANPLVSQDAFMKLGLANGDYVEVTQDSLNTKKGDSTVGVTGNGIAFGSVNSGGFIGISGMGFGGANGEYSHNKGQVYGALSSLDKYSVTSESLWLVKGLKEVLLTQGYLDIIDKSTNKRVRLTDSSLEFTNTSGETRRLINNPESVGSILNTLPLESGELALKKDIESTVFSQYKKVFYLSVPFGQHFFLGDSKNKDLLKVEIEAGSFDIVSSFIVKTNIGTADKMANIKISIDSKDLFYALNSTALNTRYGIKPSKIKIDNFGTSGVFENFEIVDMFNFEYIKDETAQYIIISTSGDYTDDIVEISTSGVVCYNDSFGTSTVVDPDGKIEILDTERVGRIDYNINQKGVVVKGEEQYSMSDGKRFLKEGDIRAGGKVFQMFTDIGEDSIILDMASYGEYGWNINEEARINIDASNKDKFISVVQIPVGKRIVIIRTDDSSNTVTFGTNSANYKIDGVVGKTVSIPKGVTSFVTNYSDVLEDLNPVGYNLVTENIYPPVSSGSDVDYSTKTFYVTKEVSVGTTELSFDWVNDVVIPYGIPEITDNQDELSIYKPNRISVTRRIPTNVFPRIAEEDVPTTWKTLDGINYTIPIPATISDTTNFNIIISNIERVAIQS